MEMYLLRRFFSRRKLLPFSPSEEMGEHADHRVPLSQVDSQHSPSVLSPLIRLPRETQRTIYVHSEEMASRIDILEGAIRAHGIVPRVIRVSKWTRDILALLGHEDCYHRPTGAIPLGVSPGLLDEVAICEGALIFSLSPPQQERRFT